MPSTTTNTEFKNELDSFSDHLRFAAMRSVKIQFSCGAFFLILAAVLYAVGFDSPMSQYVSFNLFAAIIGGISILGSFVSYNKYVKGSFPQIHDEGIAHSGILITWNDISKIYLGWEIVRINLIPTVERKSIKIVSQAGKKITFNLKVVGKISQSAIKSFDVVHKHIIAKTHDRLWQTFYQDISKNKYFHFGNKISINSNNIALAKLFHRTQSITLRHILHYAIQDGQFILVYNTNGNKHESSVAVKVEHIANIHILCEYLDTHLNEHSIPINH